MADRLLASEGIYAFMAWLSSRKQTLKIGATEECSPIPELIDQFCEENKLKEPRDEWWKKLVDRKPIKFTES